MNWKFSFGNKKHVKKLDTDHSTLKSSFSHKVLLIPFLALVGLGGDALTSIAYGLPGAFIAVDQYRYLALFVLLGILTTIFILFSSYSQIIDVFPSGGGGYVVASKLLSPVLGMISGCALLYDYVLVITISIASGTDAIFSFLPVGLAEYKFEFNMFLIILLILLNLRGMRESILPLVPIFVLFMGTHLILLGYAFITHIDTIQTLPVSLTSDIQAATLQLGILGLLAFILHAFALGAGTYTGIEAVSNAVPIHQEPKVQNAKKTMKYISTSLALLVFGFMMAYMFYNVKPQTDKTLNAITFEYIVNAWFPSFVTTGGGFSLSTVLIIITLSSEAAMLYVAAQTGFLDGPRVLANMALDKWIPTRFALLNDKYVVQNGVLLIGGAALCMLFLTQGVVDILVVLFSITVFITFSLSQAGMVRYWWNSRQHNKTWKKNLFINGIGFFTSLFILLSITIVKFTEGGWLTLVVIGIIILLVIAIQRHYAYTTALMDKTNDVIPLVNSYFPKDQSDIFFQHENFTIPTYNRLVPTFDTNARTAVILVNGFNGLGLLTISEIFKLFSNLYENFVFVEIGRIDAGVFKGINEVDNLQKQIDDDAKRYVRFMQKFNYYAEGITTIGTDVVEEIVMIAPKIVNRFPRAVFFGGQLIFSKDKAFSRWLHNYIVFALQPKLYFLGIPFLILPIKVEEG